MKKLSAFIVKRRIPILIVFLVFAVAGALLMNFVTVNYDMTVYLPEDSVAKAGVSKMAEEFGDSSQINLMIRGLTPAQKEEVIAELESRELVSGVIYDAESADHNNGDYALFVLTVAADTYSPQAVELLKDINTKYKSEYEAYTSGPINDAQTVGVSNKVLALAVIILIVVLVLMSSSWFEPILFFAVIGIAVLINEGTNAIFSTISSMTASICALLQLVLSMDYSIMLMDRYRQERETAPDKETAMQNAISGGFLSIASSSVTTIAGLLCLVFMSFTIGMDMGLAMVKGVFFSLLCVLFVLPGLVLLFDKVLLKTRKKPLSLPFGKVARFEYKARKVILPVFLVLFVAAFIVKDFAQIDFAIPSQNEDNAAIDAQFADTNSVILLYENADEDKIDEVYALLERDGIKDVSGYANTLGKEQSAKELSEQLDMQQDALELMLYEYYKVDDDDKMTLRQLVDFIQDDVSKNAQFSEYFTPEILEQIDQLALFIDPATNAKSYTSEQLADLLGMEDDLIDQVYYLYYRGSANASKTKMTLSQFFDYLLKDVASNKQYASFFNSETLSQLRTADNMIDAALSGKSLDVSQIASLTGMPAEQIAQLFTYASLRQRERVNSMTIPEFLDIVLNDVAQNPNYASMFDAQTKAQLTQMNTMVNAALAGTTYSPTQLARLLEMDATLLDQLFYMYDRAHGTTYNWTLTPKKFVNFIVYDLSTHASYRSYFTADMLAQVKQLKTVIDAADAGKAYSAKELASFLAQFMSATDSNLLKADTVELLYLYYFSGQTNKDGWTISLYDFIGFLISDILPDERFAEYLEADTAAQLQEAQGELEDGKQQLVGEHYSRLIITTTYAKESEEVYALLDDIQAVLDESFGSAYLVGDSPVANEMKDSFAKELNFITLLTILAVFVVVAITFRSLAVPTILVLLIQGAVYMTLASAYLTGTGTYYLAMIIVQAILMGASIDYAILFTEYYRKLRKTETIADAISGSYKGSIMTILTSSSILFFVTLIVGLVAEDPTTAQVCLTIAKGAFFAVMSVIFVLPALLALFDRLVCGKKRAKKE